MIKRICVRRGAKWLDKTDADWFTRVTRPIILESCRNCVAGQVFDRGDPYLTGYAYVCATYGRGDSTRFADTRGFHPMTGSERLWQRQIRKRREAAKRELAEALSQRDHKLAA